MTRDEILNMPAGRGMDALIEKLVFCHAPYLDALDIWRVAIDENMERVLPKYSTDITAAWEVTDKINRMIAENILELENDYNYLTLECVGYTSGYAASFDCLLDHEWFEDITNYKYAARADTAPLAICRAALLAVMDGVQ